MTMLEAGLDIWFRAARVCSFFVAIVVTVVAIEYGFQRARVGWQWARGHVSDVRPRCLFFGAIRYAYWPPDTNEMRQVSLLSLHRRSFAAAVTAFCTFLIPILLDFNLWLADDVSHGHRGNPWFAVLGVHCFLFIQVTLWSTIAYAQARVWSMVGILYVASLFLVALAKGGFP